MFCIAPLFQGISHCIASKKTWNVSGTSSLAYSGSKACWNSCRAAKLKPNNGGIIRLGMVSCQTMPRLVGEWFDDIWCTTSIISTGIRTSKNQHFRKLSTPSTSNGTVGVVFQWSAIVLRFSPNKIHVHVLQRIRRMKLLRTKVSLQGFPSLARINILYPKTRW